MNKLPYYKAYNLTPKSPLHFREGTFHMEILIFSPFSKLEKGVGGMRFTKNIRNIILFSRR